MTKQLRSPEWKSILEILVWILSGNSHADQPTERRLGGENRAGDSYVAKSCMPGKITSRTMCMTWYLWETRPESRSAIHDPRVLQLQEASKPINPDDAVEERNPHSEGSSTVQDLLLLDVITLPMSVEDCWWCEDHAHRA